MKIILLLTAGPLGQLQMSEKGYEIIKILAKFRTRNVCNFSRGAYCFGISCHFDRFHTNLNLLLFLFT